MRPHGKYSEYVRGCRCEPCSRAAYRYEKSRRVRLMRGPLLRDPARLREHVANLRASGMTLEEIAHEAGYPSQNWLHPAVYTSTQVRARTEERILAVKPRVGNGLVDATGSRRRLQALAVMGWSLREVEKLCDYRAPFLCTVRKGDVEQLRAISAASITSAYDSLAMRVGGSTQSKALAKRRGWVSPLAWDDEEIDDPAAKPHTPKDVTIGHGRPLEYLLEDYQHTWDHHGGDVVMAAERIGMKPEALYQRLLRARRDGISVEFSAAGVHAGRAS
jgi:hypothetical protein